eukprot:321479_1
MAEVDFYFDIVCPFAHIASTQINELCAKYNIIPTWKPVLLGGLYQFSKAPQGKRNSATTVMSPVKRIYSGRDNLWQKMRCNVTQRMPPGYPVRTLEAQRLLTAIDNNNDRIKCAKELYSDLWVQNQSMTDIKYLSKVASKYNININVINDPMIKQKLTENTRNAANKYNMFGVPGVVIRFKKNPKQEHFFWGADRFPLVNMLLRDGALLSSPKMRLLSNTIPNAAQNEIEFWFDFASPWSFLGYMRMNELNNFAQKIIYKPVVLGAIFVAHGTKSPAVANIGPKKRAYQNMDFGRWFKACGVRIKMNSNFPVRTILPLRVFIIDERTIDCIFKGCWQSNINIGDKIQLRDLLNRNGFDGDKYIKQASSDKYIKGILKENTDFAIKKGMFGCPTYVVNKDYNRFCWGQDRLYFVKDLCCGWKPPIVNSARL